MQSIASKFRDILLWVYDNSKHPTYVSGVEKIVEELMARYAPIGNRRELESFLPSTRRTSANFADNRKFLYLPPVTGRYLIVPLLSIRFNLDTMPEVRLRVGLFLLDKDEKIMRSIGFRFETPEGEGTHNFYHAQLISDFEKDRLGFDLVGCPTWLPTTEPTLPLKANNPAELLICLLVSLYGWGFYKRLVSEGFSAESWSDESTENKAYQQTIRRKRTRRNSKAIESHPSVGS
jgi:hypothetical protein